MKKKRPSLRPLAIANSIGAALFFLPFILSQPQTRLAGFTIGVLSLYTIWLYLIPLAIINIIICFTYLSQQKKDRQRTIWVVLWILLSTIFLLFLGIPAISLLNFQLIIPQLLLAIGFCSLLGWFLFKRR